MIETRTEVRVRYADTDQMRLVYHAKYFEYFEQGRSDLMRSIGLPYSEVEMMGLYLPVLGAYARFRRPAKYDDLLVVRTMLKEPPLARIKLEYIITRNGDSEVLVDGYTIHAFVNAATGKVVRAPDKFSRIIRLHFSQWKDSEDHSLEGKETINR